MDVLQFRPVGRGRLLGSDLLNRQCFPRETLVGEGFIPNSSRIEFRPHFADMRSLRRKDAGRTREPPPMCQAPAFALTATADESSGAARDMNLISGAQWRKVVEALTQNGALQAGTSMAVVHNMLKVFHRANKRRYVLAIVSTTLSASSKNGRPVASRTAESTRKNLMSFSSAESLPKSSSRARL